LARDIDLDLFVEEVLVLENGEVEEMGFVLDREVVVVEVADILVVDSSVVQEKNLEVGIHLVFGLFRVYPYPFLGVNYSMQDMARKRNVEVVAVIVIEEQKYNLPHDLFLGDYIFPIFLSLLLFLPSLSIHHLFSLFLLHPYFSYHRIFYAHSYLNLNPNPSSSPN